MTIKQYTCPHCGQSLQIDLNNPIKFCPYCAKPISFSSESKVALPKASVKRFVSNNGVVIGSAYVPDDYEISAEYEESWRSEMEPIFYRFKARRNDHHITMSVYSKQLYHDLKNPFLKGMLNLSNAHVKSGYIKFVEPEEHIISEANRIAGLPLTLTDKAKLPSPLGKNQSLALDLLESDIKDFASFVELNPERVSRYTDWT